MLHDGAFDGRTAFGGLLQGALTAAAQENWRELILCDADFHDWPLGERATVEALQAWATAGRTLQLVASDFGVFAREHARFVQWRQRWDHIMVCSLCSGSGAPPVPSAIWTPGWFMHRIDPDRCRGVSGTAPERRVALRQVIDECLRHGQPGFAASTLGL
jgi:hypothetical protein